MSSNKKIEWLLILQGWAMLWVVIGHSGPSASLEDYPNYALTIYKIAYSFHMPLFIMISGFLFYLTRLDNDKWKYGDMMKEKLIRFGIPFVTFTILSLFLKNLFSGSVDRPTTLSLSELFNAILYPYNGPMREFWFIATIMWLFSFFPLWKIVLKSKVLQIIVCIVLIILCIWQPNIEFLAIRELCAMAIYFLIGIVCARYYKNYPEFLLKTGSQVVALVVGLIIYLIGRIYEIPLLAPLGGALSSLGVCLVLFRIYPKTFHTFRNYTYQIYLIGIFFNVMITILRARLDLPFAPMYLVSLILGLYMPVLISKIVQKINYKPFKLCIGLK